MGRIYSAVFEKVAVSAAQDLFELIAPSDAIVIIHAVYLSQDSDDATSESEMLNLLIHRGTATGSGGSAVTPSPLEVGDAAFGGTVEANNTTQSVEGTLLHSDCFNVLSGYAYIPTPEARPVISPSGLFIVELQDTPSDELTMSGTLLFEEIGG